MQSVSNILPPVTDRHSLDKQEQRFVAAKVHESHENRFVTASTDCYHLKQSLNRHHRLGQ